MAAPNDLILYQYSFSPFARRVSELRLSLQSLGQLIKNADFDVPHAPSNTLRSM